MKHKEIWMRPKDINEKYELSSAHMAVTRSNWFKRYGSQPEWYRPPVGNEKGSYYDIGFFLNQHKYESQLRTELTKPEGLYYTLTELWEINQSKVAKYLGRHTGRTHSNFNSYLSFGLWTNVEAAAMVSIREPNNSMTYDFAKYGNQLLKMLEEKHGKRSWKDYYKRIDDEEEASDWITNRRTVVSDPG